jgi:hypothetical protein
MPVPIRQERHALLPDGTPQERQAAALEPEALARALRTRVGLQGVQQAVRATFLPYISTPQLEQVAEAVDKMLGRLAEPEAETKRRWGRS